MSFNPLKHFCEDCFSSRLAAEGKNKQNSKSLPFNHITQPYFYFGAEKRKQLAQKTHFQAKTKKDLHEIDINVNCSHFRPYVLVKKNV